MKSRFLIIVVLALYCSIAVAQKIKIKPINKNNVEGCMEAFLGDGVVLKSVQTNLIRNRHSLGTFDEQRGQTGIDSGIILSTGSVKNLIGKNKG